MKRPGEITVFLSLSLLCIFALLCVMVEGARTAGSRYYFQVAANGSLDTLFSQYHRELWKQYRVLGLPYESEQDIIQRLDSYVEHYLAVENWYPMRLEAIDMKACDTLTDQEGDFFIQEVLDYMKFGIWDQLEVVPEEGESFWKDIREASAAGTVTESYSGQEREVQRLEDCTERIVSCVQKQEGYAQVLGRSLADDDADTFYREAKNFRREAGRMDSLLEAYEKRAQQLKQAISRSQRKMEDLQEAFQEDRKEMFDQQMNPYDAYVEEDGRRYQELVHQKNISLKNLDLLDETEELVEQLEEAYEYGKEEDETEESFSLEPAARCWEGFISTTLTLNIGKGDKEKQGFLEQVQRLVEGGLLQMVLPDGMEVSKGVIKAKNLPSHHQGETGGSGRSMADHVLINEYCSKYFLHALSQEKREVQYELEYLLHGKKTDQENLEETVTQLFLIRQGMNMIYLLSDSGKQEEARALAAVITGVTGLAPLLEIVAGFILVVWAMGESMMDVRDLLSGGTVPLWKERGDWKLSLDGLLEMGKEKACIKGTDENPEGRGFSYETYLKLMLLVRDGKKKQLRMMDMVQMNIQRAEAGFSLDRCAYRVDIQGRAVGRHIFFNLPVVEHFVHGEKGYPLEAVAERAY